MGFIYCVYYSQEGKGFQYLSESVDLGNADAALYLSYLYYTGCGVKRDVGKVDELVKIAMRRGSSIFFGTILPRATEIEANIDKIDWVATRPLEKLHGILNLAVEELGITA